MTGGTAHERIETPDRSSRCDVRFSLHDLVKLQSRRYSPDKRNESDISTVPPRKKGVAGTALKNGAFILEKGELHLTDYDYMQLAIELAKKGAGRTAPNPLVGAVLVKDGRIIGRGYHAYYGGLHAERAALQDCTTAGESPEGAVLYVTLEPCCHYGQQPPCTEAIIKAKIVRVVIGSADPNPLVAGKGVAQLRAVGIEVIEGFLKQDCDAINPIFFHYITKKMPYVAVKYAMTLDGKIATITGASKWITGEAARKRVHELRTRYAAIMVGVGTVCADNPLLTARGVEGKNPVRIVCDTHLRTPPESRLVQTAGEVRTIIATCITSGEKLNELHAAGCEVWSFPETDGRVDIPALMSKLAAGKIDSIFVEGGGTLLESLFAEHLVQKVYAFIAPKIFGGTEAKTPVEGKGIADITEACLLENCRIEKIGADILLEADILERGGSSCLPE